MTEATDLSNRIAQRLETLGMSEREASLKAVGQPDAIRYIRDRQSMPAADRLMKIARALETTVGWLLGETDDIAFGGGDEDEVEIQQWDIAYGMGGGAYLDLPVTGERHKFSRSWLRQFTHAPADRIFIATGTGDSMTPTILDSDMVVVDTSQREVRMADKIWAAAYGHTGIIKRLRPMPDGSVKILSDNPNVPPETAYDGELHVVGRIVAIIRKT